MTKTRHFTTFGKDGPIEIRPDDNVDHFLANIVLGQVRGCFLKFLA